MALRYGSKIASSLRYNQFNSSVLRYGSKIGWTSGGEVEDNTDIATPAEYFTFTSLSDGTYSLKAKDVTNIPENVILPSVYNGKPVTKIEDGAFIDIDTLIGCSTITSVIIPDSVTTIGGYAFVNCPNLTSVTIGNGVVIISASAFRYCLNLTSVVIGDSVTTIDEYAFYDCRKLTSVIMGNSVTTIGENAFGYCSNLTEIVIPDSVTSIGVLAFQNCGITTIYIPIGVTSIGSNAFSSGSNLTIYCEVESQPEGWDIRWNESNDPVVWGYTLLGNDYLTFTEQTDGTYSVKATDVSVLPSVVGIPFSYNGKAVTAIDENAFYSATINKVVIPEGVTRIGNGAFDNCKRLLNVSLPNTLTEIGGWAFRDCTALTSIVIPLGVATIGTWAFLRDMSLTINCEAASQPSGWHTDWNISGGTVVWGYTG